MPTVCVVGNVLTYRWGGGHLWAYLNWALGLREAGADVVWLEPVDHPEWTDAAIADARHLRSVLARYDLGERLALCTMDGGPLPEPLAAQAPLALDDVADADLLLCANYGLGPGVVRRFRRSALLNIDPGLLESWIRDGGIALAPYDAHFTIGSEGAPAGGVRWLGTRRCVALSAWPPAPADADAPFTTVTHWSAGEEWFSDGEASFPNDKREGFLPFLEVARATPATLELALDCVDPWVRDELEPHGWHVRLSYDVAKSPWAYRSYIARSRGEFSCAKPSCRRLANGWISDRTVCYLASAKPAVVQDTGPLDVPADSGGLLRFDTVEGAVAALDDVLSDYERHATAARRLAEEEFAADRVAASLLERALA